jgi:hypothetical protein
MLGETSFGLLWVAAVLFYGIRQTGRLKTGESMPCAVFEKDDEMSRAFATKEEAWKKADEAGLIDSINGTPVLRTTSPSSDLVPAVGNPYLTSICQFIVDGDLS